MRLKDRPVGWQASTLERCVHPLAEAIVDVSPTTSGRPAMKQLKEPPPTAPVPEHDTDKRSSEDSDQLTLWQLNLLRVGYAVMGVCLAVIKWPLLFDHEPWSLAEGTKQCMLIALSVLALLGLRYPLRMLPILLFEVAWKLLWLGVVALPLWQNQTLQGATRTQTDAVLWVVVIIAVIPWRYVLSQYLLTPGQPWRRNR